MSKPATVFVALALLLWIPSSVEGQSLYGEGVPADQALVRLFAPGMDQQGISIGAQRVSNSIPGQYQGVAPGLQAFQWQGKWYELVAQPGQYYSVFLLQDDALVFGDPSHSSALRAQILGYNLIQNGTMSINSGDQRVMGPIASRTSEERVVNPVEVPFSVVIESVEYPLPHLVLSRGASLAVIAWGTGPDEHRVYRASVARP